MESSHAKYCMHTGHELGGSGAHFWCRRGRAVPVPEWLGSWGRPPAMAAGIETMNVCHADKLSALLECSGSCKGAVVSQGPSGTTKRYSERWSY